MTSDQPIDSVVNMGVMDCVFTGISSFTWQHPIKIVVVMDIWIIQTFFARVFTRNFSSLWNKISSWVCLVDQCSFFSCEKYIVRAYNRDHIQNKSSGKTL